MLQIEVPNVGLITDWYSAKTQFLSKDRFRAWLRADILDGKELFPTSEGTPQGGVINQVHYSNFKRRKR